ncbi:hypothetical protein ACFY8W_03915 [Streptomyces sp. NPDC012637]|uniref:hypothetical protein n=1 Tax=Streptomyces sp. NPDC012637 TaxID=3364842 RepID=UPI0036E13220
MLIARGDQATLERLQGSLARSVAHEGIDDGLISVLNEILDGTLPSSPPSGRGVRPVRWLLRSRRPPCDMEPMPISGEDAARLVVRLQRATPQVIALTSLRSAPAADIARLRALHEAKPKGMELLRYLRLFALALLTVLDVVCEDDA